MTGPHSFIWPEPFFYFLHLRCMMRKSSIHQMPAEAHAQTSVLECWSMRKSSWKTYMVWMLMRDSYVWNFIFYSHLFDSHSVIVIHRFCMCLSMFLQRKWHQYLKKLRWKMSPCNVPWNMIRLVMVFKSQYVYFTAALWSCSSQKIPLFIFPS